MQRRLHSLLIFNTKNIAGLLPWLHSVQRVPDVLSLPDRLLLPALASPDQVQDPATRLTPWLGRHDLIPSATLTPFPVRPDAFRPSCSRPGYRANHLNDLLR